MKTDDDGNKWVKSWKTLFIRISNIKTKLWHQPTTYDHMTFVHCISFQQWSTADITHTQVLSYIIFTVYTYPEKPFQRPLKSHEKYLSVPQKCIWKNNCEISFLKTFSQIQSSLILLSNQRKPSLLKELWNAKPNTLSWSWNTIMSIRLN